MDGRRVGAAAVEAFSPARLGPGFRRLLASAWASNLADGIGAVAAPLLVESLTGSPALIALAATMRWVPSLVFGLPAGVLADRVDRRRVVIASNVVRVVAVGVLAAAIVAGSVTVALVLGVVGVVATAEVFADNAFRALTPALVDRDDLPVANARLMTGFITLDQLAGVQVGALLFVAGRAWPFVTEIVLLAAAVVVLRRLHVPPPATQADGAAAEGDPAATTPWRTLRRDVVEGFVWTWRHAAVRTLAVTILVFNVTFGAAWSVLVLWSKERLGLPDAGYGLLMTVSALGGLVGTSAYGWLTRRVSLGGLMRIGLALETLTHFLFAVVRSPVVAMVAMFAFGAQAFVWGTTSNAVRQRAVPLGLQGRVGAVYNLCVYGGLAVGSAVAAVAAEHLGVTAPFWFAGAGDVVLLVVLWTRLTRIAHDEPHPATA